MAAEVYVFLLACLLGILLGVFYDFFRVLRMIKRSGAVLCFLEDMIFFIVAAAVSFSFIMVYNNGILRGFILFGELLGATVYFFSFSVLIIKFMRMLIRNLKRLLLFIYSKTLQKPVEKAKKATQNQLKAAKTHCKTKISKVFKKIFKKI